MIEDSRNQYLYNAEGRICAAYNKISRAMVEYLYDADGNRVGKGTITSFSCDTASNGFSLTNGYVLGPGGQQLSEYGASVAQPLHTNVWAAGQLIATDSLNQNPVALSFEFEDWLGTRRVLTDSSGVIDQTCPSLPYGDGEPCPTTPTEHLFTQHERDTETNNDYFGARYYSSDAGRFLSPDWSANVEPVPYAKLDDPQSLNLYDYVRGNPLASVDPDGHWFEDIDAMDAMSIPLAAIFYGQTLVAEDARQGLSQAQEQELESRVQQQVSQAGQDFIKGYEKLSLTVYDASKGKVKGGDWTIGYGHKTTKGAGPITLPEAEALFQGDVARMASHVAADLDVPVSQNQFDALVSLRFNAGANAITPPVADLNRTGHATMGDFTNHYITAGGVPMRGLELRRAAEWRIFSEGVYDASH